MSKVGDDTYWQDVLDNNFTPWQVAAARRYMGLDEADHSGQPSPSPDGGNGPERNK